MEKKELELFKCPPPISDSIWYKSLIDGWKNNLHITMSSVIPEVVESTGAYDNFNLDDYEHKKCDECKHWVSLSNASPSLHRCTNAKRTIPNMELRFQHMKSEKESKEFTEAQKKFKVILVNGEEVCNICNKPIAQLPHSFCKPEICGWCGSNDNTDFYRYAPYAYWYNYFCAPTFDKESHNNTKKSLCYYKFGQFVYSDGRDLRNGLPAILKLTLSNLLDFDHDKEKEGFLTCAFCAATNGSVIKCPYLPSYFLHTNFCQNRKCCNRYYKFMTDTNPIPHAVLEDTIEHLKPLFDEKSIESDSRNNCSSYGGGNCILISNIQNQMIKKIELAQRREEIMEHTRFHFKEKERIRRNKLFPKEDGIEVNI
jgi:hypothetical protein